MRHTRHIQCGIFFTLLYYTYFVFVPFPYKHPRLLEDTDGMFCVIKLLFVIIAASSACKSGNNRDDEDNRRNRRNTIVHLNHSLIPVTPNSAEYNSYEPIKSVISEFIKESEERFPADRQHVKHMRVLNGSANYVYSGPGDYGFFSAIYEAYNNH